MAANTKPIFVLVPKISSGSISTGDTSRTTPTNAVDIFTAGENGSRIEKLKICHLGTNSATVLRLFYNDNTNYHLIDEIDIAAYTSSDSVAQPSINYVFDDGLVLPPNTKLSATVTTNLTSGLKVTAFGGDF